MPNCILTWADGWQRRHTPAAFAVAVARKFGEDDASRRAALVAYYAFFSLFPLLLAFVSILGFALQGDPGLREAVVDTVLARIPVIGTQLRDHVHPLTGSAAAVAVGLAGSLWAGLAVTSALADSFAAIWDVPRSARPGPLRSAARGLAVLAIVAVTLVAATAAAGRITGHAPLAERGAAVTASLAVDAVVLLAIFVRLTPGPRHVGEMLPGVALGVLGWTALESAGAWYVNRTVAGASATYGTFALVIGLLSWFWLAAQVLLLAAEANVVLRRRLWPRGLTGALEPADRTALARAAEAAREDPREHITVTFGDPPPP